jgi:hypothetical protein
LEGIEKLTKLIKKNNKIIMLYYDFGDFDVHIELKDLFDNLLKCKNKDKINKYIEQIEKMIIELKK